jgi:uncharacterized protein (TIGR02270 family)
MLGRPPVYADIVEEHFDELDALWEHREANVFTPDWTLRDLADHEARAEAHLDGLRLAELHGVDLARARLGAGARSAATAATFVLWESGDVEARKFVWSQFLAGEPPVRDGIRLALRHLPIAELRASLLDAMTRGADVAVAALDVLTFHRLPVPPFDHLMATTNPGVLRQVLGAAGRSRRFHADDFATAVRHPDPGVRSAALHAAARAGLPQLADTCRAAAISDADPSALAFLGILGDARDLALVETALRRKELAATAISALGVMGQVSAVPVLLELMSDPVLGKAATAAYKRITGAMSVEGEKPFPPPPVAEGEDEDEALPPDPAKAKDDWGRREPDMTAGRAWQSGIAIDDGVLPARFDELPLDSRRDMFLRLRWRSGAAIPDIELEALAARQRAA